jgi:putative transposase
MSRGNDGMTIFRDDQDRTLFLALLAEEVTRCRWILHDYSLMGNHYHLSIGTPECNLSKGMHRLLSRYAQRFNRRHGRRGHLFQERFKSVLVEEATHATVLTRYIALNAVRAGFCERPEQWRWCSYAARAGYAPAFSALSLEPIMSQFGATRETAQAAYREFVLGGVGLVDDFVPSVVAGMYVGSAAWMKQIQMVIDGEERSTEHPRAQVHIGRPDYQDVVTAVATAFDIDPDSIGKDRGSLDRMLVAYLAFQEGLLPQRVIAGHLSLLSAGAVSSLIKRARERLEADPLFRELLDACCKCMRRQQSQPPLLAPPKPARSRHRGGGRSLA